jgi:nucleoside diphosphate kinase
MGHDANCKATGPYGEGCTCGKDVFSTIKFPHVKVKLVGENGNAFMVLGLCVRAAKKAGLTKEQIDEFQKEATSGDYDHLLCTCTKWFDVS